MVRQKGTLSKHQLTDITNTDFSGAVRPEIDIIRGVGTMLGDLFEHDVSLEGNELIPVRVASIRMLSDVVVRAVGELEEILEGASDWFRAAGLAEVVRQQRDQKKAPAVVAEAPPG